MTQDPLNEMLEFLKPNARVDLKHVSLDHMLGLSGTEEGVETLLKNDLVIQNIIELTDDKLDEIAKTALLILVNISAHSEGASELLKYKPFNQKNLIEFLIGQILNPNKKNADAACMILCNITRLEDELEICLDAFFPHLNDIINVFVNVDFNKTGSNLNYLAPMFSNLSCSYRIRKWLTEENPHVPLIKLLPFCNYEQSHIRRGGAIGTVRNLSFDSEFHEFLLSPDLDLLTYLLTPIMGNEEYPDDEMDVLPIALQYLPKEKRRDLDVDIRKMILETLNKLCMKRKYREMLRDNGVYYVLREYHKWETDPKVRQVCENVVDILIQKEEEVGVEDLSTVEIPRDVEEKFQEQNKRLDDD
ncbi:protein HGH1 homolog [Hyposmocoma kahamanoa]|uniref:protein HGH1 homolog n=1 Tax=Hyposmocoma kahamanoa TaxID=1477025 RepID=UPI000E6D6073|nr:protein HGH1 homolog [Hyposmocoma kahamanoa]